MFSQKVTRQCPRKMAEEGEGTGYTRLRNKEVWRKAAARLSLLEKKATNKGKGEGRTDIGLEVGY